MSVSEFTTPGGIPVTVRHPPPQTIGVTFRHYTPPAVSPAEQMRHALSYIANRYGLALTPGLSAWPPPRSYHHDHRTDPLPPFRHYDHGSGVRLTHGAIGFEGAQRWPKSWGDPDPSFTHGNTHEGNTPMATPPRSTPYDRAPRLSGEMMTSSFDPEESDLRRKAEGLSVGDLDALARERWMRGYRLGQRDGIAETDGRLPDAYREGWSAGRETARANLRAELDEQFGTRIHLMHEVAALLPQLESIAPSVYREALAGIAAVLGDVLDEFRDPDRKPREARRLATIGAPNTPTVDADADAATHKRAHVFGLLAMLNGYVPAPEAEEAPAHE